jgi:hypothetical protein
MADTLDMIIPLLREMRAENAARHAETRELMNALDKRLEATPRETQELERQK